jgi:AcrR family transcriptional regulator
MPGRTQKVSSETWVETARRVLVEEGIAGVKVDRLAQRLGVTRGGFYHNFKDREDLLDALLHRWEEACRFLPKYPASDALADVGLWFDRVLDRLIEEDGYDHDFDMAVREWARSDQRAAWAVERSDRERMGTLQRFFDGLGYSKDEALIRARVFYYHQIGYYAIGVRETTALRKRNVQFYVDILCGHEAMERVSAAVGKERKVQA